MQAAVQSPMGQTGHKILSMSATNTFWIAEDELAKALGVDRPTVKRERPYVPTGGVRANGKAIEWRDDAASALAIKLGLTFAVAEKNAATAAAEPQKNAASSPEVEDLTVVSAPRVNGRHFANPNLIQGRRATGELVYVRVLDSAKYQPTLADHPDKPMVVKARKAVGGNWWELVSREPRWRGRF